MPMRAATPALVLTLLIAACGGEEGTFVLEPGDVVRSCTRKVYAERPFGTFTLVDRYAIDFEVTPEVRSFAISAWDEGASTTLAALQSPTGFSYDLVLSDELERFHPAAMATLYGVPVDVDRFMVPPSPNHTYMVEPGTWQVRGDTGGGRFCVSIAASDQPGTELDLAVYVVGVDALSGDGAATNGDWREVLERVQSVFGDAGIHVDIDDVPVVELGQIESVRFSMLRSWTDFQELVATSQTPPRAAGGPLRLNVFLIRGFGGDLPPGLLGVASGVPGAAGVHGTRDSGIVFGVEDWLGVDDVGGVSGNTYLGDVMAHEIGHFLGLFHTSEIFGGSDPLDDTPACPGIDRLENTRAMENACDDSDNLMFPIALPGTGTDLSALQVDTVRLNPLLRPSE